MRDTTLRDQIQSMMSLLKAMMPTLCKGSNFQNFMKKITQELVKLGER